MLHGWAGQTYAFWEPLSRYRKSVQLKDLAERGLAEELADRGGGAHTEAKGYAILRTSQIFQQILVTVCS